MLASRAGLQPLVVEQGFGNLGGEIRETLNQPTTVDAHFRHSELQLASINLSRLLLPECCKGVKVLLADWGVQKLELRDWA